MAQFYSYSSAFPTTVLPTAHWKFNDNAANSLVADSIGNYNGEMWFGPKYVFFSNGVPYLATNTNIYSTAGKVNNALLLDCGNGAYDLAPYVNVASAPAFYVNTFTVALWSRNAYVPTDELLVTLMGCGDGSHTYGPAGHGDGSTWQILSLMLNNNHTQNWFIGTGNSTTAGFAIDCSPAYPTDNVWHHYAFVWTPTDIWMYRDGVKYTPAFYSDTTGAIGNSASVLYPAGVSGQLSNPLLIGRVDLSEDNRPWSGAVDDVRFYSNTVLSQDQVLALYNSGTGTEADSITTGQYPGVNVGGAALISFKRNITGNGGVAIGANTAIQTNHPYAPVIIAIRCASDRVIPINISAS